MVLPAASGGARPPAYGPVAYRWVVLAVVMAANAALQSLWIGYAPMTEAAQAYYGVDETRIGLFAMVFMLAFIPLSLPASWLIDVRGARFAVTAGAVLAATGGVWRGLAAVSYTHLDVYKRQTTRCTQPPPGISTVPAARRPSTTGSSGSSTSTR